MNSLMKVLTGIFLAAFMVFSIGCEDGPLDFDIVSPSNNSVLKGDFFLELEGKSKAPIKSVVLKAGTVTINLPVGTNLAKPNKKWNIPIAKLEDGINTFSITVTNQANETKTKQITVTIQKPDPNSIFVQIVNPGNNATITADFPLKISVSSVKPVLSYWIKYSETDNWRQLPANHNLEWQIKLADLKEGEQILSVTANNGVRYAQTASIKILVRKPLPVAQTIKVKIVSPKQNDKITQNFTLKLAIESQLAVQSVWVQHKATGTNWNSLQIQNNQHEWSMDFNQFVAGKQLLSVSVYNGKEYAYDRLEIIIERNAPIDRGPGFGNCYEYHGDFGNTGETRTRFRKPYYIQISNDRRLFVTDSRRNKVLVYDRNGKHLFNFGKRGSGPGQFDNPVGICIYKNERIFVSDYLNRRVGIFDINGNFIKFFYGKSLTEDERFKLTGGVAVNEQGELFVVDFEGCRIFKFSINGEYITTFGKKGSGNGEMDNPTGITISRDNFIYVTDKKNDRVVVFDSNGVFSFSFGAPGSGRGELSRPMGIAVDKYNHIYVSDTRNNRIMKYDHRGKFICEVARNMVNPIGVAIDNETGIVYVVDRDASLIRMYRPCARR